MSLSAGLLRAIDDLKDVAMRETEYPARVEAVMTAAAKHWLVTGDDDRFRAACGALMLTTPERKGEIEAELRGLKLLAALIDGLPLDVDRMIEELEAAPKPTVSLRMAYRRAAGLD